MGKRKKALCTPEQWAAILEAGRAQYRRPEVKAAQRLRGQKRWIEVVGPRRAAESQGDPHYHRARRHGLSSEACASLLALQGNRCAVCAKLMPAGREKLDHDHDTGAVRGFLCAPCNTGEGWVKKWGAPLAAYLANPPAAVLDLA